MAELMIFLSCHLKLYKFLLEFNLIRAFKVIGHGLQLFNYYLDK